MKEIKALKIEELTLEQKIGMLDAAYIARHYDPEELEYVFDLIRNRSLGAVWIQIGVKGGDELIAKVKEIADYPILIITDAESGIGEYKIGRHNALGCTGSEAHAYAFGKATAITARKMGYNVVCDPVLDLRNDGSPRSYGSSKEEIARLAAAEARGFHDGGILTVAKHYPSGNNPKKVDTHMAEGYSEQTAEQLYETGLYAYRMLIKEGLLDGIMAGHHRFVNIDDAHPASLSKSVIDIIRNDGFDGFFITDALGMMGIIGKFGKEESKGLAIAAGNDLALTYTPEPRFNHEALITCYKNGIYSEERLNEGVRHVLRAQAKTLALPKYTELTEEDIAISKSINADAIYERVDEGVPPSISKEGKHLFALMVRNESNIGSEGRVEVDTFSSAWLFPSELTKKIEESFPNSTVIAYHQFPSSPQNCRILSDSVDYDDLIFITFAEPIAYTGREHITRRVETLINAAQSNGKVSTLIHFGNPCVLDNLPHIPRIIIGGLAKDATLAAVDILSGERKAVGRLTYDAKIN